jgi:hypothetical protein
MPRNAIYAALLGAVALGIYLFQLWTPERQVELHSRDLLSALESGDASALDAFLSETYADDWGQDKALVLSRLRQVMRYGSDARLAADGARVTVAGTEGEWRARIVIEADANELTAPMLAHVNGVTEPWVLQWRRESWKPWDWQLVCISNPSFELPRSLPW